MRAVSVAGRVVGATVLALLSVGYAGAGAASAQDPYRIVTTSHSPQVRYFESFDYETAKVVGGRADMAADLTRKVHRYTFKWTRAYLYPNADLLEFL